MDAFPDFVGKALMVRGRATGMLSWLSVAMIAACTTASWRTDNAGRGRAESAFVGVNVLPMTAGDSILRDHTVLVRGGEIVAVGPANAVPIPARARRVGTRGQYLMPGLIDSHVHLEYFDDPAILVLFLANGVTAVRNMDGRPYLLEWKRRIDAGEIIGPTIYTAGPILDGDPPVRDDNTVVRSAAEAHAVVAAQDSAGYDFVKVYTGISAEAYQAVVSATRERGMPVAGHVPRRMSLGDVLAAGQHSIEHLTDFDELVESDTSSLRGRFHWSKLYLAMAADPVKITSAAQRVAASGVWIVPTAVQAQRALAPLDSIRSWLAGSEMAYMTAEARASWQQSATRVQARMDSADWSVVERGRANRMQLLRALHAAGANLATGTDTPNPFVIPGFSLHEEIALFIAAGIPSLDALAAATREGARLLNVLGRVGTIEAGKRADLLLVPENPLTDPAVLRKPAGVMLNGNWFGGGQLEEMLRGVRRSD